MTGLAVVLFTGTAQAQRRGGWGGGGWGGGGWGGSRSSYSFSVGTPYAGFSYGRGYPGYGYGGWGASYYGRSYGYPYGYNYGWANRPYYNNYYGYPYQGYAYGPTYTVPYDSTASMYTAPADTALQAQSYQSFYNTPSTNLNQTTVRVSVPQPDARVWVDDRLTQQQGTDRVFVTPALTAGQQYSYTVRASWMENGREMSKQKTVTFTPGQEVAVNFMDAQDRAITDVTVPQGTRPAANDRRGTEPSTITPANRPPADNPPRAGDDRREDQSKTGSPAPGRLSDNTDTTRPNQGGQGAERQGSNIPPPPPPPKR